MIDERHTPIPNAFAQHNGIKFRLIDQDEAEAVLEIGPDSLNPYHHLHGGAYYTMADCASGCACRADGRHYVTLHGGIDFIRSADHGTVTARAKIRHRGGSTCQTTVEIRDEAGTLLALGDFTFFCLDHK